MGVSPQKVFIMSKASEARAVKAAILAMEQFEERLGAATTSVGEALGIASVTATEGATTLLTAREQRIVWLRALSMAPSEIADDRLAMQALMNKTATAIKKTACDKAVSEFDRRGILYDLDDRNTKPRGWAGPGSASKKGRHEARRKGSRGFRQRKRSNENWLECFFLDRPLALSTIDETCDLNHAKREDAWATAKRTRASEGTHNIYVGVIPREDSFTGEPRDPFVVPLGEKYRDEYAPYEIVPDPENEGKSLRVPTKSDFKGDEYVQIQTGPSGDPQYMEAKVQLRESGKQFAASLEDILVARAVGRYANAFVDSCMDAETFEWSQLLSGDEKSSS